MSPSPQAFAFGRGCRPRRWHGFRALRSWSSHAWVEASSPRLCQSLDSRRPQRGPPRLRIARASARVRRECDAHASADRRPLDLRKALDEGVEFLTPDHRAHSGDLERLIRSIMNTNSGDHEHPLALALAGAGERHAVTVGGCHWCSSSGASAARRIFPESCGCTLLAPGRSIAPAAARWRRVHRDPDRRWPARPEALSAKSRIEVLQ